MCATALLSSNSEQTRTQTQSRIDRLAAKQTQFRVYANDFLDFAKSAHDENGTFEHQIALDLNMVASEEADFVDAFSDLVELQDEMKCAQDRTAVSARVDNRAAYYRGLMQNQLKNVNIDLGYTKRPGVAAEALRLKDDLRETLEILQTK